MRINIEDLDDAVSIENETLENLIKIGYIRKTQQSPKKSKELKMQPKNKEEALKKYLK